MIKELNVTNKEEITSLFLSVFKEEPWNDDWSDKKQLDAYMEDLIGNKNSLSLGYFQENNLIGIALGNIKHWYSGTEYLISELCIKRDCQGHGLGKKFLVEVEEFLRKRNIHSIFLETEKNVYAYKFYLENGFQEEEMHVCFSKKF